MFTFSSHFLLLTWTDRTVCYISPYSPYIVCLYIFCKWMTNCHCLTSLIHCLAAMFQGWRGRVGGVPVPDRWCEEGVWRILQRVQGGIPKVGALHRGCPCPAAWIGKKLVLAHAMFGKCKYFQTTSRRKERVVFQHAKAHLFFLSCCITKAEMSGQRRDNERGREGSRNGWRGVLQREKWKREEAGTTRKAKNVMIQDERKGSRGRGVMAGGGESESERKTEKRGRGRVGGQSSQSQLAMPTCASCS